MGWWHRRRLKKAHAECLRRVRKSVAAFERGETLTPEEVRRMQGVVKFYAEQAMQVKFDGELDRLERKDPPKQWIVMRTDLKMRKGKQIAQGGHAAMKYLIDIGEVKDGYLCIPLFDGDEFDPASDEPCALAEWIFGAFTKICVRTGSEEELEEIYNKAKEAGLPCALIVDSGKTEFNGVPTKTCCAIGPCYPHQVKHIVGDLKLL